MLRRDALKAFGVAPLAAFAPALAEASKRSPLHFSCREDNDLYRVAKSSGISCIRSDSPTEAVSSVGRNSALLVLAERYPHEATQVDASVFQEAARKRLRLYVEFPSSLPHMNVGKPQMVALGKHHNVLERAIVASDSFAPGLKKMRILSLHECYYVPISARNPELVLARVAGFDTAVYGLPQEGVHPILMKDPEHSILIAATRLSSFIQGRYDPAEGWAHVWNWILSWLSSGQSSALRKWVPTVHPSLGANSPMPKAAELEAFRKGVAWFSDARLFVAPQWKHYVEEYAKTGEAQPGPHPSWPLGNGSDGVLEGFSSTIKWNGQQPVGWNLRADCAGETSMAMACSGVLDQKIEDRKIAANLNDFIYFRSALASGPRNDPHSSSYGLVGWNVPRSPGIYYGDDNARMLLGSMAAAGLIGSNQWDEKILLCLLANLRTTGVYGFRPNRITESQLQKLGWRHFYDQKFINYHPHFEAYPWACFLRAYEKTRFSPFLERARTGIRMTMEAYPNNWRWTNGFQQERARMLLPLAWLIRLEDTQEHRRWLKQIATDLLAFQVSFGGIREDLGNPAKSAIPPPASNDKYGTSEVSLIEKNGDPACDMLYTCNFAFLGLHEAAAATGDAAYREAEDRLAHFLCRIQIESKTHPEFTGGWFRAFDYRRWDYWASASDWGWGPWSIETGWTQTWISSLLGIRRLNTSLWDITGRNKLNTNLNNFVSTMFS